MYKVKASYKLPLHIFCSLAADLNATGTGSLLTCLALPLFILAPFTSGSVSFTFPLKNTI